MALSTYDELKSTIADFLNRDDLTSIIPTFIELAESQMSRDIRHWKMESRATSTTDNQYLTRPSDWVETKRLRLTAGGTSTIEYLNSTAMDERRANSKNVGGTPRYYTHIEDQFELWPSPGESLAVELIYFQKIPALSDSETTNWVLDHDPDIYLYGSLLHSAPYLANDERINVWAQLYSAAVVRLNQEARTQEYSGMGIRMRKKGLDTGRSYTRWRFG